VSYKNGNIYNMVIGNAFSQLMDYMVSLHCYSFFIMAWGVLDNGPLYCITLCPGGPGGGHGRATVLWENLP
jgi:hypothetical protein